MCLLDLFYLFSLYHKLQTLMHVARQTKQENYRSCRCISDILCISDFVSDLGQLLKLDLHLLYHHFLAYIIYIVLVILVYIVTYSPVYTLKFQIYPFSESANAQAFIPHFVGFLGMYWIQLSRPLKPMIDSSIDMSRDGTYADWNAVTTSSRKGQTLYRQS